MLPNIKKIRPREFIKILILRTVGNFLIFSSLFMVGKTFYQPIREEVRYYFDKTTKKQYVVSPVKGGLSKSFKKGNVQILVPEDPDFSIVIPEIGANSRIIANVNAANEEEYLKALQKGVAHADGTSYPGEGGHIFLFAHSTDYIWNVGTYNAVFYLLYKLEQGQEVNIFYKGQRYVYKVVGKKVVDPSEVEFLTRKTNKEFLTLQTCWPPGTAFKRLLVFATRVAE